MVDPIGYLELIGLVDQAALRLTDSGGLQVESTILGVPCLTVRTATEWSETVSHGTNRLVSPEREAILDPIEDLVQRRAPRAQGTFLEGWDGAAGRRVLEALAE